MSLIAQTVSSMGVWGSGRWQKAMSTKSRPKRSSDASMAWVRYLRFSVFFMLGMSCSPQKNLDETTYSWRRQPSSRKAAPMTRSDSPAA